MIMIMIIVVVISGTRNRRCSIHIFLAFIIFVHADLMLASKGTYLGLLPEGFLSLVMLSWSTCKVENARELALPPLPLGEQLLAKVDGRS
jgi:hypothetical protein